MPGVCGDCAEDRYPSTYILGASLLFVEFGLLARISRPPSTAVSDSDVFAALRFALFRNVLSRMSRNRWGVSCPYAGQRRLATKPGEKCGPGVMLLGRTAHAERPPGTATTRAAGEGPTAIIEAKAPGFSTAIGYAAQNTGIAQLYGSLYFILFRQL